MALCFVSLYLPSASSQSAADSCSNGLTLGSLVPFNTTGLSCFQAWPSQDFILRFGKSGTGSNVVWTFVLSAPDNGGYISIGFSPTGRMVGSSAVAGWVTSAGAGSARQYYLGGTSSRSCPPDQGKLTLARGAAAPTIVSKGSRLYLAFQLAGQPLTDVVYAVGPRGSLPGSNGLLPQHQDMAAGTISLSGGSSSGSGSGSPATGGGDGEGDGDGEGKDKSKGAGEGSDDDGKGERRTSPSSASSSGASGGGAFLNAKRRHGVLAIVSWGVMVPAGVALARFFKRFDPFWFYAHVVAQGLGFVLGVLAVVAGFRLDDDEGPVATHKAIGIVVLVCACLQVMALLARPAKETKARRYWNWYHHNVGRVAIALGVANIFYGLSLANEGQEWSYVYGIFIGIFAVVYLVLEEWRRRIHIEFTNDEQVIYRQIGNHSPGTPSTCGPAANLTKSSQAEPADEPEATDQIHTANMKPRSCSSSISSALLVLLLCCFCSSVATANSCASSGSLAAAVSRLIPFDTSNLTCFDAWTSQGFIVRYGKSGHNTWSFVLSAPDGGGYVAVGFSSDGAMVGSSAVAGWTAGSGVGVAKQYRLGGTSSGSCPPDQGSLALVPGTTLLAAQASRLYLAFQFTAAQPAPYLIYAVGPSGAQLSNNYLVRHSSYASAAVNYATGVASSASSSSFDLKKWHGAMAGLGWGVLMPVGVALARYFKRRDPFWFYAHISVQGVGFVLGTVGVVAGFRLNDDVPGADSHQALGIAILIFGCLQVLAFLARPDKGSKVRRYWNWYHHNVGRAAVACAVANVFVGLSIAHEAAAAGAFYGIFLAVWVVASVVLEIRLWRTG
ncbi:Cytochrome b561 and DOMON domain-containing protein [Dichanthelium oligosanthes]|uniref:Cytochrome b561 and DOMON domain-containing protein n=1 Tax=Dichanthelium oligosanthes TaxID=888268 RepID=A0A1E5V7M7_9POAL|nr:Cytochrome b561 and DOMON domain-containing protein [Dichanthelium oligosanthes]